MNDFLIIYKVIYDYVLIENMILLKVKIIYCGNVRMIVFNYWKLKNVV